MGHDGHDAALRHRILRMVPTPAPGAGDRPGRFLLRPAIGFGGCGGPLEELVRFYRVLCDNRGRNGLGFGQGFVRYGDIPSLVKEYKGSLVKNSNPKVTATRSIEAKITCSKLKS